MKNKSHYLSSLKAIFSENTKPLAKIFFTGNGYFLYDTGTNKILECGKEIYELIILLYNKSLDQAIEDFIAVYGEPKFIEVADEILSAVDSERILQAKPASQFGLSEHFFDFEKSLDSGMKSITLEVTEQCNLRCSYCLYNEQFDQQRNHGHRHMPLETAYRAIHFLKERASGEDSVAIGFYGGEPLLRFPFIQACVQFARENFRDKKIIFNITTNATLITDEIAEFLLKENFFILVSLDGPEDIHNSHRKDKKGNGSFQQTLNCLKLLMAKHKQLNSGNIAINAVYTPPFSLDKINAIHRFIAQQEWLSNVSVTVQYANASSLRGLYTKEELKEDIYLNQWAIDEYKDFFQNSPSMVKGQVEKRFAKFLQRGILSEPMDCYTLNGCCVPGQRKCFVTTCGSLKVCEKMFVNCPSIGHVNTGFDFKAIKKDYIEDYAKKSLPTCSRCWALRLCEVCYTHAFNQSGQLDLKQKHRHCYSTLKALERSLRAFIHLMAQNPEDLDYLYQYEIE